MTAKFYECESCKGIFHLINSVKGHSVQSDAHLKELMPNTVDASHEKHVPVIHTDTDNTHVTVMVGEVEHPMTEEHHIAWIAIETETGMQIKYLKPGGKPHAEFVLTKHEKLIAAYEYCNIHGLWKKEA